MAKKILHIVESAYRATIEEQDDTVLWFSHAMKGGGADVTVVLRGNAVNYAVKGQDASGVAIGGRKQTQPPRIDEDVGKLVGKGVEVYLVKDDASVRGIEGADLVAGVKSVGRAELPKLLDGFDTVFHW